VLGAAVGALIVLTNLRTVLGGVGVEGGVVPAAHVLVAVAGVAAVAVAVRRVRRARRAAQEPTVSPVGDVVEAGQPA
jgi:uncharacterized protein